MLCRIGSRSGTTPGRDHARPTSGGGSVAEHPTPAPPPPDGCCPTPAWAVTTGGDHDGYEVAAVFADGFEARRYATWWNDEEIRRYGHLSTRAVAEEIDFYPAGTWRPPTHLHLAETDAASSETGSPKPREPRGRCTTDDLALREREHWPQ